MLSRSLVRFSTRFDFRDFLGDDNVMKQSFCGREEHFETFERGLRADVSSLGFSGKRMKVAPTCAADLVLDTCSSLYN